MKAERDHEYYQVFARRKADEPMHHVGTVGASEPDDAEVFAFKLYDQWRWTELFVAPSASLTEVRSPESSRYLVFARSRYEVPLDCTAISKPTTTRRPPRPHPTTTT